MATNLKVVQRTNCPEIIIVLVYSFSNSFQYHTPSSLKFQCVLPLMQYLLMILLLNHCTIRSNQKRTPTNFCHHMYPSNIFCTPQFCLPSSKCRESVYVLPLDPLSYYIFKILLLKTDLCAPELIYVIWRQSLGIKKEEARRRRLAAG